MIRRISVCRLAVIFGCALLAALFAAPAQTHAQGLELNGGWGHVTQDFGMDGVTLGASWFATPRIAIAANYDGAWDTSRVGAFEFTDVGAIAAKSHIQNFLIGPRYFFAPYRVDRKRQIIPFADAQFGVSHLHQSIQEGEGPTAVNQDSAFSWMVGGGVDYPLAPHWMARGELGLLRTHLNADAQSRARLAITVAYTFGTRATR